MNDRMEKSNKFGESFYAAPDAFDGNRVVITGPEAKHIAVVLRRKPGDVLRVVDGKGGWHAIELVECAPGRVTGEIRSSEQAEPPSPELWVVAGLIRATRMDDLVERCAELGALEIVPLLTKRSLSAKGVSADRIDRWRRIAAGAMTQSARLFLPHVHDPVAVEALGGMVGADSALVVADPSGGGLLRLKDGLRKQRVVACVGPEGGFTPEEVLGLMRLSAELVSLGKARLRTETAAAALVDRLAFLLGH